MVILIKCIEKQGKYYKDSKKKLTQGILFQSRLPMMMMLDEKLCSVQPLPVQYNNDIKITVQSNY